jgi:hypothetical protein
MCFGTMDPNNADVARQQRGRGRRQQQRQVISDEIRATLVHHAKTDHLPCCYYDTCNVVVRID